MAHPRTVGSTYWHTLRYPSGFRVPFINWSSTTEIDPPFRSGPCMIVHLPATTRALVIGRWTDRLGETEAWTRALGLRILDDNGVGLEEDYV
jgi:hypothetical protein